MDYLKEFINPELYLLIPVMYFIGIVIRKSKISNKFIPLILGIISILLAGLYIAATGTFETAQNILAAIFTAITQGILIAGASVYVNQMIKQKGKQN